MNQLLVECSEPGLVVSLAEEFEYVVRHVDFERAMGFRGQLSALGEELGADVHRGWRDLARDAQPERLPSSGVQQSRDTGRGTPGEVGLRSVRVGYRYLGSWPDLVTPADRVAPPETRKQYVRDLATGIRGSDIALGVFSTPVPLPEGMADHRERLVEEHLLPTLRGRARFPALGREWVRHTRERLGKALE